MIKHLALDETRKMNLFPAKGGVSKYYSPKMIIKQTNVDYNKHIKIGFGSYVQANQENSPSNTQEARTRDAIYLSPVENLQGGHRVFDLKTRKVITRPKVTAIPVTDTVIKAVEALAERDGVESFKFLDRNKVNIDHDSFIAGAQEENDRDYHDEDYEDVEQEEDEDLQYDEEITEEEIEDLEEDPEELAEITGVDENDVISLDAGQNQVGNDQLDPIDEH